MYLARDTPRKYIPMCIRRIRDARRSLSIVTVRELYQPRHYIHADDVASAVLFLINYKGKFEKHEAMQMP